MGGKQRSRSQTPFEEAQAQMASFRDVVEAALDQVSKPALLGRNSPLATPYLLHTASGGDLNTPEACGRALCRVIEEAVESLQHPRFADRYKALIREYYFKRRTHNEIFTQGPPILHLAHASFHDSRRAAIDCLEKALLERLTPALRLEAPPRPAQTLFGRQNLMAQCAQELRAGKSVQLTGMGGIGKSSLASHLARQWEQGVVFWYTVRTNFNDQLNSFLFALGHFLHQSGEPLLWSSMTANGGKINPQVALAIARRSLEALRAKQQTPLLCIDELDLLRPAELGPHGEFVTFVGELRGWVPLLLIGQQGLVETDAFHELKGLTPAETKELLGDANVYLSPENEKRLHDYTQGNPRLLELFAILYALGGPVESTRTADVLNELRNVPPLEYLLGRILHRLPDAERAILLDVSVYRNWAPADVWQRSEIGAAFDSLIRRGLIQSDGLGGVALLAAFREVIYRSMLDEQRAALHRKAAAIHAARGAYTATARHLLDGGLPLQAYRVWLEHQAEEINQGQAVAALQMLRGIASSESLTDTEVRDAVTLQCSQLESLLGNPRQALKDLDAIVSSTPTLLLEKHTLEGKIQNDLSDFERAQDAYQHALAIAGQMVGARLAHIHKGLAWLHMRERDMDAALRESQLALYEAENITGYVLEALCDYLEADEHYRVALALAERLKDKNGIAKTSQNMSRLCARQGQFERAKTLRQLADRSFEDLGRLSEMHNGKINWALIYNLNGEFEQAKAVLQEGVRYFTESSSQVTAWPDALFRQALAEACLDMGNLDEATRHIEYVIGLEEKDVLPDAYRTLGEIMFKRGHLDEAERLIRDSIQLCRENEDAYLEGFAWRALAQVYKAQGDMGKANEAKDRAISLFQKIRLPFEVQRTEAQIG